MILLLIKSFNRAFYLDRCLGSIYRFVKGEYKIIVLDDGTPAEYLEKISNKYPAVEIRYSEQAKTKRRLIRTGIEINGFEIPTVLWRKAVQESEEYVLVTEDDVWFTHPIDLGELVNQLKSFDIHLLKLGWMGKQNEIDGVRQLTKNLYGYDLSKIFTGPSFLMDWFMYNRFKFFSALYKLKLVDNHTKEAYWRLNSIHMGLWRKDYWLYVWKDSKGKVDEIQQLRNAAEWLHRHKKERNIVARLDIEIVKTTFQSSATNSYHEYGVSFDINHLNHLLNEAWLHGQFKAEDNFPNDFPLSHFEKFFDSKLSKDNFRAWVAEFKKTYQNVGVMVD